MFMKFAFKNIYILSDSFSLIKNRCSKLFESGFFDCRKSFDKCYFSTSPCSTTIHTTKGWKIIARTGQKNNALAVDEASLSCEEGTDAVHHSFIINELQSCKTVAEQIETFSSLVSLSSEDIEKRNEFCNSLEKVFQPYFSEFKVHLFGSSINGLGFKGSDVDISFQTTFDNQDYLRNVSEVPTLDSVINGATPPKTLARLPPRLLLRFVRRILRQDCKDVKEPILLIKARCPILRFYNAKFDLYCDFSCENEASLRNTKLIRILCLLDKRFAILTKFIRYWGKHGKFVGDIDMFNSYAFSLLVVNFLQQTNPPVLPALKDIIEASEYLIQRDIQDKEQFEDVKKIMPSENTQPVEELLREYFFYFLNFDYSRIMMPLTSSMASKSSFLPSSTNSSDVFVFSPVSVQDPFRTNFNTTAGAMYKSCRRFLNGVLEACKVYQNQSVWDPNAEMWGLSSLFIRPMSDEAIAKEWQENRTFTINLPLKSKSDIVKKIFQECLLIECIECTDLQANLKLNCKVYNDTWQGRDWVRKSCPQSIIDVLEIENWVSNAVLKSRGEYSKQVLFTFTCKCFENTVDSKLYIDLSFPETKCSPVIAVFLKEYVPMMYIKLMM